MYKQKNNKTNKNNGITLIALVLTIIVLLVLAGVVLSLALGQNGLVFKARETKQKQEIAQEKDKIITAYGATFVHKDGKYDEIRFKENLIKEGIFSTDDDKLNTITESPLKIELVRKHDGYTVTYTIEDSIVNHKVGDDTTTNNTIPADLQVGDTIIYDPTKGVTDQSKLTYTSEVSKNGFREQKIIAKPENKEWVVISTSGGQVKMMSKEPIDGIEGGIDGNGNTHGFTLKGGKGYLYAEEELHKACSVFGHGKGAGKISTKYTVGNPYIGEAEERTLSGSGARSLTKEDIVKIMKGNDAKDFTEEEKKNFYSGYKTSVSPEVYYPTKVSTKESRSSDDKKSFTQDYYSISKNKYTNYAKLETETAREALVNSIFKDKYYWYGSRCVYADSVRAIFRVGIVFSSNVYADDLFWRHYRFAQCVFLWVGPKTCGLLGLFRPIREE